MSTDIHAMTDYEICVQSNLDSIPIMIECSSHEDCKVLEGQAFFGVATKDKGAWVTEEIHCQDSKIGGDYNSRIPEEYMIFKGKLGICEGEIEVENAEVWYKR